MEKCRSCGKEVSELASSCPHCGAPDPGKSEKQRANDQKMLLLCITFFVVAMILVHVLSWIR